MALPNKQTSDTSSQNEEISIHLASDVPNNADSLYFVFPVGLEGLNIEYGTRSAVTQALDAFWLDSLGPAVITFTISGHTGYLAGKYGDGKSAFLRMLNIHRVHQQRLRSTPNSKKALLYFIDKRTGFHCWCFANTMQVSRDHGSPNLYHFTWNFTVAAQLQPQLVGR